MCEEGDQKQLLVDHSCCRGFVSELHSGQGNLLCSGGKAKGLDIRGRVGFLHLGPSLHLRAAAHRTVGVRSRRRVRVLSLREILTRNCSSKVLEIRPAQNRHARCPAHFQITTLGREPFLHWNCMWVRETWLRTTCIAFSKAW